MRLSLVPLADSAVIGIYGPKKDKMPERTRFLHPDAAASYLAFLSEVIVSDMLRSADSSLDARRRKRGAMRPAYSGHNYGFSIDLDVDGTMKRLKLKTKQALDVFMIAAGWTCHRFDGKLEHECWHYNHSVGMIRKGENRSSSALERKILAVYGDQFKLGPSQCQEALRSLKIYSGDIDGKIGPLSKEATQVFQRAWQIPETGKLDAMTIRTLAFVTATR